MGKQSVLTWESDVRLLLHPLMLRDFAKLLLLTGAIMAALLSFLLAVSGQADTILPTLAMAGVCMGGLAVLFVLVILAFFRNRMHMRFRIDGKGASSAVSDRRADIGNRLAIAAGALAGKPGVAGAGMLGRAGDSRRIAWNAVEKVRFYPAWHAIALGNSWRSVVTLFCTPENYADIATAVAGALAARAPRTKTRSPLPKFLLRTVLAVLASTPLFLLPELEEGAILPALLVMAFALTEIWLIPLAGWVVFAGLIWLAGLEIAALNESHRSIFGGTFQSYEVLSDDDIAMLVLAALGAAVLVWQSVGYLRGRIMSALTGDMAQSD